MPHLVDDAVVSAIESKAKRLGLSRMEYLRRQMAQGLRTPPVASMPVEYLTPAIEDRAVQVQLDLAERSRHRAPALPDLLIAATAELAGLTVLHLDKDFDLIAGVTGQSVERLAIAE